MKNQNFTNTSNLSHTVLSASSLESNDVQNPEGENLGNITEIMIDTADHSISYYVLSFGGILGMGNKLFAIPAQALRLDTENKCFVLNVAKDKLKNAEGFDKDNWPDFADQTFRDGVNNYYGFSDRNTTNSSIAA